MTVKENALTQEDQEDEEEAEEEAEAEEEEEEDSDLAAKESDAIAALMSLANAPVVGASNGQSFLRTTAQTEHPRLTFILEAASTAFGDGCATPALTRSARTSFSQAEDVVTPEQYEHSLEGTTYKCKMCDVNAVGALSSYERLWAPVGDQYLGE
ncbi:hypothetical protein GMOD_00003759 [Pyrenophora seminiperda CCB06]|uniref:Uncharacterized protein n=1 Tax=Pyrenophora seminiperda CCB06 TaxID=1302712 RepID=A0A3M7MKH5_9PLEO|nr:hypothetical protein GMOD_00003759 [Pyrenophora seminiperda CCB06]